MRRFSRPLPVRLILKDPVGWKEAFQAELDSFDRLEVMESVQRTSESHRATQCGVRSPQHSVPLEYASGHLRYRLALDWLVELECFEATGHVCVVHNRELG